MMFKITAYTYTYIHSIIKMDQVQLKVKNKIKGTQIYAQVKME